MQMGARRSPASLMGKAHRGVHQVLKAGHVTEGDPELQSPGLKSPGCDLASGL